MTGRRSPAGRDAAAAALGDYVPSLGRRDAALFVDRLAGLADAGEAPGSLLARLNLPARIADPDAIATIEEPAPSRSTLAALGTRPRVETIRPAAASAGNAAPAGYPRIDTIDGRQYRIDVCRGCDQPFSLPRRNKPGRYPVRCEKCRNVDPRSEA